MKGRVIKLVPQVGTSNTFWVLLWAEMCDGQTETIDRSID